MIFNTTCSFAKRICFHRNDLCNFFQDINFKYVYLSADCGDKFVKGERYFLMGKFKCIFVCFCKIVCISAMLF